MTRRDVKDLLGAPPDDLAGAAPVGVLEVVVLRFLARVVHADGHIDPRELELLLSVAETMALDGHEARLILEDELARRSDAAALARQIADPVYQRRVFALGCLMAISEGHLDSAERDVLDAFARGAELSPEAAKEILDEVAKSSGQ